MNLAFLNDEELKKLGFRRTVNDDYYSIDGATYYKSKRVVKVIHCDLPVYGNITQYVTKLDVSGTM